jgi:23S rRNA-/tRNA-specific pseudouridylate synthase
VRSLPFKGGGFVFDSPSKPSGSVHAGISDRLALSNRKWKALKEHRWMFKNQTVIPWGFWPEPSQALLAAEGDFVAVNKPPFMTVVGGPSSLLEFWRRKFPGLMAVHRLDFETSGVLLFARGQRGYALLSELFKQGRIHKSYLVWVKGKTPQKSWDCSLKLASHYGQVLAHPLTGKSALTRFKTLRQVRFQDKDFSLVRANPVTGRQHQIRVHLYSQQFPIVGEPVYGGECGFRRGGVRMLLHAQEIAFQIQNKQYTIQCPSPSDFDLLELETPQPGEPSP